MRMNRRLTLIFAGLLASPLLWAESLDGYWQHEKQPVWIEVRSEAGVGSVVRNDNRPEAVGFEMLRNLQAESDDGQSWVGEVFAAQLGEYKTAEITLQDPDTMRFKVKVGFMSRTVEWQRVQSVPGD